MDFFLMSFAFDTYTSTEMIREQKNKQSINETSLNKFLDLSHDQGHALALSQCLRFFPFVLFFVPYSNERGVHSPAGRACATVRQLWGGGGGDRPPFDESSDTCGYVHMGRERQPTIVSAGVFDGDNAYSIPSALVRPTYINCAL